MSEWKPIADAPRDGRPLMLANQFGVWVGYWNPVYVSGYRPDNPWSSLMLNHSHMSKADTVPNHYMELPEPPK